MCANPSIGGLAELRVSHEILAGYELDILLGVLIVEVVSRLGLNPLVRVAWSAVIPPRVFLLF